MVTPDVKVKTVFPIIHERVLPSSTVYTDEYSIITIWPRRRMDTSISAFSISRTYM
jgi:hypothetical protein